MRTDPVGRKLEQQDTGFIGEGVQPDHRVLSIERHRLARGDEQRAASRRDERPGGRGVI